MIVERVERGGGKRGLHDKLQSGHFLESHHKKRGLEPGFKKALFSNNTFVELAKSFTQHNPLLLAKTIRSKDFLEGFL